MNVSVAGLAIYHLCLLLTMVIVCLIMLKKGKL